MTTTDDFLAHYGVLGMKWGVRKKQRKAAKKKARRTKDGYNKMSKEERAKYRTKELWREVGKEAVKAMLIGGAAQVAVSEIMAASVGMNGPIRSGYIKVAAKQAARATQPRYANTIQEALTSGSKFANNFDLYTVLDNGVRILKPR